LRSIMLLNPFLDLGEYNEEGDFITPRVERFPKDLITPIPKDLKDRLPQAANAAAALMAGGMEIDMSVEDEQNAEDIFSDRQVLTPELVQNPAIVLKLSALLSEYDHRVVKNAAQLRQYTTNKLIELSHHKNPSTQLRALELLGKITEVGLFTERTHVTVEHQTTAQIQEELKKTVAILLDPSEYKTVTENE
jgi:hypothetical protein